MEKAYSIVVRSRRPHCRLSQYVNIAPQHVFCVRPGVQKCHAIISVMNIKIIPKLK